MLRPFLVFIYSLTITTLFVVLGLTTIYYFNDNFSLKSGVVLTDSDDGEFTLLESQKRRMTETPLEEEVFQHIGPLGYRLIGTNIPYKALGRSDLFPVAIIDTGADHNHDLISPFMHLNFNTDEITIDSIKIENDKFGYDFADNDLIPFDDYSQYYSYESVTGEHLGNFLKFGLKLLIDVLLPSTPGHGTHVSGTMLQACNNLCSVVPIRIKGSGALRTLQEVKQAIQYAKVRGYRLLNLSLRLRYRDIYKVTDDNTLTLDFVSDEIGKALEELREVMQDSSELLFVVAAGNETIHFQVDGEYNYPINFRLPNILTVGAVDETGLLAPFSNFDRELVDVYAYGVSVENAWPRNKLRYASGTSMASPLVAGLVGNLWAKKPSLTSMQVKTQFLELLEVRNLIFDRKEHNLYQDHREELNRPVLIPADIDQLRNRF